MIGAPTLYVIPTPLGGAAADALPAAALGTVRTLGDFVAENAKSARAFLKEAGLAPRELRIHQLAPGDDPAALLQPLREGRAMGLLSEAGCPAVADPGATLVAAAHRAGFRVAPLVGPSAIVLALMASGLEGQRFVFRGYLPRDAAERQRRIRELEDSSRTQRRTEIFIETPYRGDALFSALLQACHERTRLCVAVDLTLPAESVRTRTIAEWRRLAAAGGAAPGRRPAVFLLLAHAG